MFDSANKNTFKNLKDWLEEAESLLTKDCKKYLVATKVIHVLLMRPRYCMLT
jgi:hypothetical protein